MATAIQMPITIKRKPGVGFFGFRSSMMRT